MVYITEKRNEYDYKTTGNDHEKVERYDYRVQISYKTERERVRARQDNL